MCENVKFCVYMCSNSYMLRDCVRHLSLLFVLGICQCRLVPAFMSCLTFSLLFELYLLYSCQTNEMIDLK